MELCPEPTYIFEDAVEFQTALLVVNAFILTLLIQLSK